MRQSGVPFVKVVILLFLTLLGQMIAPEVEDARIAPPVEESKLLGRGTLSLGGVFTR